MLKPYLILEDLNGVKKYLPLEHKTSTQLVERILGEVTTTQDASDSQEYINGAFIPVIFQVSFYDRDTVIDLGEEINLREFHDGEFWKYINLSGIDLSVLQIYSEIKPNYYRDNCFVYACIKSKVFSKEEIEFLRTYVQTRKLPNTLIKEIAETMKCHFVVKRIDENLDIRHQMKMHIDTRKTVKKKFNRIVQLLLFKGHYMLCQDLPVTTYYIRNKEVLDTKFSSIPQKERQTVRNINSKGHPIFKKEGTHPMKILRLLFEHNLFREINACEYNILETCEFTNKLSDYEDLNYYEDLCTREMKNSEYKQDNRHIYYADFETDVTVSPHRPYLCCVVTMSQGKCFSKTLKGDNINVQLLNHLQNNSITYFHNLKYDACFFINTPFSSILPDGKSI